MTSSFPGVNRFRNTSPVSPSIAAATTDRACTSKPTLVRSVNTGASHTCRHCRTGPLLGNPRDCVSGAPARNERAPTYRLGDLPAEHHGVVLVRQVVTVRHVGPGEVPESAVHDHRLTRVERDQVFAPDVIGMSGTGHGHVLAVAHHGAVLLHAPAHGVDPAAAAVADLPEVEAVLLL